MLFCQFCEVLSPIFYKVQITAPRTNKMIRPTLPLICFLFECMYILQVYFLMHEAYVYGTCMYFTSVRNRLLL